MQSTQDYARIEAAIQFLSENFKEQPTLEEAAAHVHLSPFHFQRLFQDWAGISPKKFLQYLTVDFLKNKLHEVNNLQEAAELAGLSAQSRVYDHFITLEAMTPQQFKSGGENLAIHYGFQQTPFGQCLLASTNKGICHLSFVTPEQEAPALAALQQQWPWANWQNNTSHTARLAAQVFSQEEPTAKIHLLVNGTNFQVKVWEALLRIPSGEVRTYQQIAESIGNPKANRAVGTAVGQNPIAYLIPCHRVIRKEGIVGNYHWGEIRKKALIAWEMGQSA
jgi:AraC family transcriptional regulator, regulatory protein of adaptative response / methylated-DNA-[protein]-cysteine methyltransferase